MSQIWIVILVVHSATSWCALQVRNTGSLLVTAQMFQTAVRWVFPTFLCFCFHITSCTATLNTEDQSRRVMRNSKNFLRTAFSEWCKSDNIIAPNVCRISRFVSIKANITNQPLGILIRERIWGNVGCNIINLFITTLQLLSA